MNPNLQLSCTARSLGKSAPKSQVKFSGKHERNQRDPFRLQARGGRKSNDLL